ncbi:MAG: putative porin, partial [Verrucomicrobiota bacterium]
DARVRYEARGADEQATPGSGQISTYKERNRYRYALHAGVKGDLSDDFFYELRLATNTNPRSANVTFGDDSSTSGPGGKTSDAINVDHIFLGWKPTDWFTGIAGRQANPLYTTSMVWDSDISLEGLTEQFNHKFGNFEAFATFGQYVYSAGSYSPNTVSDNHGGSFLMAYQIGTKYNFDKTTSFKIAPAIYQYSGHGSGAGADFGAPFTTGYGSPTAANSTAYSGVNIGTDHLQVVEVPVEFDWTAWKLPFRAFGEFAVNTEADARATVAGRPDKSDEAYAYEIGLEVGSKKKKGDWDVKSWWQHVEAFALDPNLVDADIFDSRINMQGYAISASYMCTDAVSVGITYANGDRIDNTLGNAASAGDLTSINPIGNYQLLQLDLNWKF